MKAIGYVRVSTEKQSLEGVSLKDQKDKIETYCKLKDMELVEIVTDEGVSAGIPLRERQGGQQLLNKVNKKEIDIIVSVKLDRLFRDAVDCLQNTKKWDNEEIALHLLDFGGDSLDTSSPMGRMFLTMSAGFAEMEKSLIQQRTKTALKYKKNKKEVYSTIPLGFDRVNDELKENEEELKIVSFIKQLRKDGLSYNKIAEKSNQLGLKTKKDKKFYASTISYILKNDLYDNITADYCGFKDELDKLDNELKNKMTKALDSSKKEKSKVDVIKLIKELREKVGLSLNKIAKKLNKLGIETRGRGKRWYAGTVNYIIKNDKDYKRVAI